MQKGICFLLVLLMTMGICACAVVKAPDAESSGLVESSADESVSVSTPETVSKITSESNDGSLDELLPPESSSPDELSGGNEGSTHAPSGESVSSLGIYVDYAEYDDPEELDENALFFEDPWHTIFIKIWVTKEIKNFKYIWVVDDGPYAGETLFEVDSLTPEKPFYALTTIGEGYSERGFSFEDEFGNTICYRIDVNMKDGGFGWGQIASGPDEKCPAIDSITAREFFNWYNYQDAQYIAYHLIGYYLRGEVKNLSFYLLEDSVLSPDQFPLNSLDDYRDICITALSYAPYTHNGKQYEKLSMTVSLYCTKKGQEGYYDFRLELLLENAWNFWKLLRLDMQKGSEPTGDDSIVWHNNISMQDFLASRQGLSLQSTAFNFLHAYFGGDVDTFHQVLLDPSGVSDDPSTSYSVSLDDWFRYYIQCASFGTQEVNGVEVPCASLQLLLLYDVQGKATGYYEPLLKLVYVDGRWQVLTYVIDA